MCKRKQQQHCQPISVNLKYSVPIKRNLHIHSFFIFGWFIPLMGQVFFFAISWKWAELGSLLQQEQTVKVKVWESEFIPLWDVM